MRKPNGLRPSIGPGNLLAGELGLLQVRLGQLAGLQRRARDLGAADVDPDELVAHRPAAAASRKTVTGRTWAASNS